VRLREKERERGEALKERGEAQKERERETEGPQVVVQVRGLVVP